MCAAVAPGPSAPGPEQENRNCIGAERSRASRQGLSLGLPNEACSSPRARHALTGCSPLLLPCLFIRRPEMDRPDGNQTTQTETMAKASRIYRWVPLHACAHSYTLTQTVAKHSAFFERLGLSFPHFILMSCYKHFFCCCDHRQDSSYTKSSNVGHGSVVWSIVAVSLHEQKLFFFRKCQKLVLFNAPASFKRTPCQ